MSEYTTAVESTAAQDGEIIVAGDDAEIIDDGPTWEGPFLERDKHDRLTEAAYVRCANCDVEVVTSDKGRAHHREDCPHGEGR